MLCFLCFSSPVSSPCLLLVDSICREHQPQLLHCLHVIMLPFTKLQPCVCSQAMAKADAQQSSLLERVGRQRGLHPLLRHLMREDPYATHQQLKQVVLQYAGVTSTTEFTAQYEPGFTGRRFADSPLLCNLIKRYGMITCALLLKFSCDGCYDSACLGNCASLVAKCILADILTCILKFRLAS